MDLSVNKPAMQEKFREWYSVKVQKQFDNTVTPVDLRMSVMKPLGAKCRTTDGIEKEEGASESLLSAIVCLDQLAS